jgi:hypothetical protein
MSNREETVTIQLCTGWRLVGCTFGFTLQMVKSALSPLPYTSPSHYHLRWASPSGGQGAASQTTSYHVSCLPWLSCLPLRYMFGLGLCPFIELVCDLQLGRGGRGLSPECALPEGHLVSQFTIVTCTAWRTVTEESGAKQKTKITYHTTELGYTI